MQIWQTVAVERHVSLLIESYERVCQKPFPINAFGDISIRSSAVYSDSSYALVSHGTQPDPVFNYANLCAQRLWKMDWYQFTQLPSRLSARADKTEKRALLLKEALEKGFVDHYEGIRIDAEGREFYIKNVVLWNLTDQQGLLHGQAAIFNKWNYID